MTRSLKRRSPNVERVGEFEVYLLDDEGRRLRRICGHKRAGIPEEYCCLNDAGKGTSHPGSGLCVEHESKDVFREFIDAGRDGFPESFIDAVDRVGNLSVEQLSDIDSDIKLYYVLLQYSLQNNSIPVKLVTDILDKIINAKKTKYQLRKSVSLDVKLIKQFLNQIIGIIRRNVDEATANRIFSEIISQVVLPMQRKDLVVGDIEDLTE